MKYEITHKEVIAERDIDADTYETDILLCFKPKNGLVPEFTKVITITCSNSKTGYEVDTLRGNEIIKYISGINK